MDVLIKKAEAERDLVKRRALFKQIVAKVLEDVPELPLFFVPRFFTFRKNVKGFTSDSRGSFRWWGGGLSHAWLDK